MNTVVVQNLPCQMPQFEDLDIRGLSLLALISPLAEEFIADRKRLPFSLVQGVGSPVHILFPQIMKLMIKKFQMVFGSSKIDGEIHFALKANKADCFLDVVSEMGIGADVASIEEFTAALQAGIDPKRIVVTGPEKEPALHKLALRHGALITIDCLEELDALQAVISSIKCPKGRIMLRYRPSHQPASRYGMSAVNLTKSIKLISSEGSITIEGFSAHLSGYNVSERRNVGVSLIEFCKLARNSGHHPSCIDLGGGWPVSYVSMDDWQHFTSINHPDLYHTSKNFSQFYPYACEKPGAEALDECLNSPSVAGGTLSTLLLDNNLSLVIEPGRALLDQCGLTLFQINNIKTMPENYSIINVRGQSFSLSEQWFGSEFLPDPVLLKHHPKVAKNNLKQNHVACVAGSSCLEADMLTWRKINFPDEPVAGDILAYINTAGYQMDSNETSFHRTPLPAKIAIWQQNKAYQWCLDSQFKNLTSQALSEEYP